MDIRAYNRTAWDLEVERGNIWTKPVESEVIQRAREGTWDVNLSPIKKVPHSWFPQSLKGVRILGLACGGGQQGPIFAALGAEVTILDNSPKQLASDRFVAERENLSLTTIEGDMRDLGDFADEYFDIVFNPVSNCFVPKLLPMWSEAFRVLKTGGSLMTAFVNPIAYCLDQSLLNQKILQIKYPAPYSDLTSLSDEERARYTSYNAPMEFGHTLTDQIGGQLKAGFQLVGFYEDDRGGQDFTDRFFQSFMVTKAIKPKASN